MTSERAVEISEVRIRLADEEHGGLVGWASCVLNGEFQLDNIVLYRNENGEIFLRFPEKITTHGGHYPYYRPITASAYEKVRTAILSKLNDSRGTGR